MEPLAGVKDFHPSGIFDPVQQPVRVAVEGAHLRRVDRPPVDADERRVRVGVRQLYRPFKGDVPVVVGKVEEDDVGRGLGQLFRQQFGIPRQPDAPVRRIQPVAAAVLRLPFPVGVLRRAVLPVVEGGGQGDGDLPDGEGLADVMPLPGSPIPVSTVPR